MGWGDELMVTGHARELQARDPRKVKVDYERNREHESWANNPRIAGKNEQGDFQHYRARVDGMRPYMQAKSAERYHWKPYGPPVGELYFDEKERRFARTFSGRVVVEPNIKPGASPNKDWGWDRWVELVRLMHRAGIQPAQLGSASQPRLPGTEFIHTNSMRYAAALLSTARGAVLPEGGLHHVAAAVKCPAVVIFGGFIAPAVTGYAGQVSMFDPDPEHPLGCGWRKPCAHCATAMQAITPQRVFDAFRRLLDASARHLAA